MKRESKGTLGKKNNQTKKGSTRRNEKQKDARHIENKNHTSLHNNHLKCKLTKFTY